jgi:hypothetical protein
VGQEDAPGQVEVESLVGTELGVVEGRAVPAEADEAHAGHFALAPVDGDAGAAERFDRCERVVVPVHQHQGHAVACDDVDHVARIGFVPGDGDVSGDEHDAQGAGLDGQQGVQTAQRGDVAMEIGEAQRRARRALPGHGARYARAR